MSLDGGGDNWSVIINDSLTNDFVGAGFEHRAVHIGDSESKRLIGGAAGLGPLPLFLRTAVAAQKRGQNVAIINVRDLHDPADPEQAPELLRYGDHNLVGTTGAETVRPIQDICDTGRVENIDVTSLSIPILALRNAVQRATGIDILADKELLRHLRFVLTGTHTNIRVFDTADTLVHKIGCKDVSVCPHLTASANLDAHRLALTDWLPGKLIRVAQSVAEVCANLGIEAPPPELVSWVESCKLEPEEVKRRLNPDQIAILETIFMGKDIAKIKILGGGYSGSILIMATANRKGAEEKPVVIKIDKHVKIKQEVDGYHKVKELLGMNVPSFTAPVSRGAYTGIKIDLAAMRGDPRTFQSLFESSHSSDLEPYVDEAFNVLEASLYRNTLRAAQFNPVEQFRLSDPQQVSWLRENMGHIIGEAPEGSKLCGIDLTKLDQKFERFAAKELSVDGEVCMAHRDLNFANVIFDSRKNVWFIDWTHTDDDAVEIDFAKMENDIKFVMSKEFGEEDMENLARFENYILSTIELPELEALDEDLEFVKTDERFIKVYILIRNLRSTYLGLKADKDQAELPYKTALLKFAMHTLSFDKRRSRGECELPALKYALMSTGLLVDHLNEMTDEIE